MHFMLLIFLPLLWVWFLAQTTFSCNLHKMSTLEGWNWHVSLFFMQYFLAFQLDRFEGDLSWIDPELCHCLDQLSISISAIRQSLRNKLFFSSIVINDVMQENSYFPLPQRVGTNIYKKDIMLKSAIWYSILFSNYFPKHPLITWCEAPIILPSQTNKISH